MFRYKFSDDPKSSNKPQDQFLWHAYQSQESCVRVADYLARQHGEHHVHHYFGPTVGHLLTYRMVNLLHIDNNNDHLENVPQAIVNGCENELSNTKQQSQASNFFRRVKEFLC